MKSKLVENPRDYLVTTVGVIMYISGVVGNMLVVIAVWRKRSLRSTTNYLLVNLAISDIVSFLFLPLLLIQSQIPLKQGHFADFLCKFLISHHVPVSANIVSVLTLTLLSIERYHALVKPMKFRKRLRRGTVRYAIISIWITGILLTMPFYIFGKYNLNKTKCVSRSHSVQKKPFDLYEIFLTFIIIIVPFIVIAFCYFQIVRELYFKNKVGPQNVAAAEDIRNKRKLLKTSFSITLTFGLFFFPLFVTLILKAFHPKTFREYFKIAGVLFFLEAAVNPFVYAFQSTNFRQAFKEILKRPCAIE